MFEGLEKMVIACPICSVQFDSSKDALRPSVLPCGHTICCKCLSNSNASQQCPMCKLQYDQQGVHKNFQLEDQITALQKEVQAIKSHMSSMKQVSVCLDCRSYFRKMPFDVISSFHQGHETIDLDEIPEAKMQETVWLLDILNRGSGIKEKFEKILQSILQIAYEYQKALAAFATRSKEPGDLEAAIMGALKSLIDKEPAAPSLRDEFDGALLTMRYVQIKLSPSIFKTSKEVTELWVNPQNEAELADLIPDVVQQKAAEAKKLDDLVASLTEDARSGFHILPNKLQLKMLPDLRFKVVEGKYSDNRMDIESDMQIERNRRPDDGIFLQKRAADIWGSSDPFSKAGK